MNEQPHKIHSIAHLENTPENAVAIELSLNNGRWKNSFFTPWWHVVTKLVDMSYADELDYTTIDGKEVTIFWKKEPTKEWYLTTLAEIISFFNVRPGELDCPVPHPWFMERMHYLYHDRLEAYDKSTLTIQKNDFRERLEGTLTKWESELPITTVLSRVPDLLGMAPQLDEQKIEEIQWNVLIFADCDGFWETLEEDEKSEYVMNKKQLDILIGDILWIVVDAPNNTRLEPIMRSIRSRANQLICVSPEQAQRLATNNNIHVRKRVGRWL